MSASAQLSNVPLRQLGKDGPLVPAIGFGLMGISMAYGKVPDDEERLRLLDRAYEIGSRHWDTSDYYGDCIDLLGKWFQRNPEKRADIFLATKFGAGKGTGVMDSSGAYAKEVCATSMKRMNVDYIDLYYMHRANPETPIEETMSALVELKTEGKIKHIGLCEVTSATVRRAAKIGQIAAYQIEYSAIVRDIEGEAGTNLLDVCRELGIATVAYSPLGRGLLTGAFSNRAAVSGAGDLREKHFPMFTEENLQTNAALVEKLRRLANKKSCTLSQLALAWLLSQGEDVVPIPGTKNIKYLEENWGALQVQLTQEEEKEIRQILDVKQIVGARASERALGIMMIETREE